jgi:hypothetical protein
MRSLLGSVGCREALMTEPLHSSEMAPRLLSRETAATYSGMSPIRSGKHPPSMSRRVRTAKRNLWTSKPWTHGLINNPGLAHAPARLPSGPGMSGDDRAGPGHQARPVDGPGLLSRQAAARCPALRKASVLRGSRTADARCPQVDVERKVIDCKVPGRSRSKKRRASSRSPSNCARFS